MHHIDLADARGFVAGFTQLDNDAKTAGVTALTGASSSPPIKARCCPSVHSTGLLLKIQRKNSEEDKVALGLVASSDRPMWNFGFVLPKTDFDCVVSI